MSPLKTFILKSIKIFNHVVGGKKKKKKEKNEALDFFLKYN